MKASDVARIFGATDLSWYLEEYLRKEAAHLSHAARCSMHPIILSSETRICVYKQFKLTLPSMSQVSESKNRADDIIRAVPAKTTELHGIQLESTPGLFSTVLARKPARNNQNYTTSNAASSNSSQYKNPLQGLFS
jgi:hypothetical protein